MIHWMIILAELLAAVLLLGFWWRFGWKQLKRSIRYVLLVLSICAVVISFSGENLLVQPMRQVTITALEEKNSQAVDNQVFISCFWLDGETQPVPEPVSGKWIREDELYYWVAETDERYEAGTTQSVTFELPVTMNAEIGFSRNQWRGLAQIKVDGAVFTVDTYLKRDDGGIIVSTALPHPPTALILQAVLAPACGFALVLLLISSLLTLLAWFYGKANKRWNKREIKNPMLQKILKYQFLFEELVKRDFKKKYKRTALGMAWSVLSPLLTLLVMRLVFTHFFGQNMDHYTTYLFCGNLVFSYFNESTDQGMTSLMGNADIFSKVNVPKYMFLFSKNVQTLINFGLTLCVFFVFCVMDDIAFTWKLVCLLYPIICLVLFNIGTGLILSALFVFFRDIQYLWNVFTTLLMYMSAIFYTIGSYSPVVQNLFLLNPVYLFIRYFRKIVMEATIPTIWFHLLMLADVVIVLGIGCWMYKKYNHKFLYYV